MGKASKVNTKGAKSKRVVKKSIKRNVKANVKAKSIKVGEAMSRLEYEQALMDPRFKAAMMGFNNPTAAAFSQASNQIREQENKNNALTREISYQTEIANQKQKNLQLNNELSETKRKAQQDISAKQLELAETRYKHDIAMQKNKFEHDKLMHDNEVTLKLEQQKYKDAQEHWKQQQELAQAEHDRLVQEIKTQHDSEVNNIKESTKDLARRTDIENLQFSAAQDIADATAAKMRQEIASQLQQELQPLQEATAQTRQALELNKQLYDAAREIASKKVELKSTQIKAIAEPILQQLESQKRRLEDIMKINGDVNGIAQKIEGLRTDIAVLKQKATPEQIEEHGAEIRSATLDMVPLQIEKRLAERVNSANIEQEKLHSDLVELGAKVLGNDFNVNEIGTVALNDKLTNKLAEIQNNRAMMAKQHEELKRQIKMEEDLENDKITKAQLEARLNVVTDTNSEYNKAIAASGKAKAEHEAEAKLLTDLHGQLETVKNDINDKRVQLSKEFEEFLDEDKTGYMRRRAQEITGQEYPDARCLPQLLDVLEQERKQLIESAWNWKHPTQADQTGESPLNRINRYMGKVFNLSKQAGIDLSQHRFDDTNKIFTAILERNEERMEKEEAQKRLRQAYKRAEQGYLFIDSVYKQATIPYNPETGQTTGIVGAVGNPGDKRKWPSDGRSALRFTEENFDSAMQRANIQDIESYSQYFHDNGDSIQISEPVSSTHNDEEFPA